MTDLAEILDSRAARLAFKIAGAVAAAAVLVAAGWLWMRTEDAHGQAALAAAADLVQQAEGPQATPEVRQRAITSLQQVLAEHGRTSAAPVAAYQLGNLQYQAGDYAAARGAYELALAKGASGSVRTLAASGVGYTWEAQKDYANAVTAYDALVRHESPKQFFFEESLLDLARAQALAGKPADAIATYERLLKDAPDSRRAPDVRARIAELQGKRS
ncbi:MAG TPA: tetratricopeptide repeat protein [Methylomirabilota bacterium]|nr:tetratricopeptide repeat protein [Methylomirabilota bacterium]